MPNGWKKNAENIGRKDGSGPDSLTFCRCACCERKLAEIKAGVCPVELAKGGKNASPRYAGRYVQKARWELHTSHGRPWRKHKYAGRIVEEDFPLVTRPAVSVWDDSDSSTKSPARANIALGLASTFAEHDRNALGLDFGGQEDPGSESEASGWVAIDYPEAANEWVLCALTL